MKIKVVDMTYEQALAQPPAKHRPPQVGTEASHHGGAELPAQNHRKHPHQCNGQHLTAIAQNDCEVLFIHPFIDDPAHQCGQ